MNDTPPERIWRLEIRDGFMEGGVRFYETPSNTPDLDDSIEYVRKDVMDKIIQETLWQCHGVRM